MFLLAAALGLIEVHSKINQVFLRIGGSKIKGFTSVYAMLKTILCLVVLWQTIILYGQDGFISGTPSLAYWTVGEKTQVVIVLHGGPGAAHNYLRPEWDSLSRAAKVVYYDQRGCGKSEGADCYSWRDHVRDLKRVVNTFSKGNRIILAGSSWGSSLALLYTCTYPEDVKAIVLSGTFPWPGKGIKKRNCSYYKAMHRSVKDRFYYRSLKFGFRIPAATLSDKDKKEQMMKEQKLIEIHTLSHAIAYKSLQDGPSLNDLKKIKTPVLIFEGTGICDPKNPILRNMKDGTKQFIGILPNLEVYTVKEACHDPWFTHPGEFFTKATEFVERVN